MYTETTIIHFLAAPPGSTGQTRKFRPFVVIDTDFRLNRWELGLVYYFLLRLHTHKKM